MVPTPCLDGTGTRPSGSSVERFKAVSLALASARQRKGSRPRAVHDQRTQSTYVFGAVCPVRGAGAALVLPACNTEAMQLHLDEIAKKFTPGAHAVVAL